MWIFHHYDEQRNSKKSGKKEDKQNKSWRYLTKSIKVNGHHLDDHLTMYNKYITEGDCSEIDVFDVSFAGCCHFDQDIQDKFVKISN